MSEETDALSNRIRQLENQVTDMQRLAQDTSDLFDIARANGLDKFLTGHGFWETQGGVVHFDANGMQLNTNGAQVPVVYFQRAFSTTPSTDYPRSDFNGSVTTSFATLALESLYTAATKKATLQTDSESSFSSTAQASSFDPNYATIGTYADSSECYVNVLFAPFKLASMTADPSTTLADGELWYRSDTDKFRARANGATQNLATEGYVVTESASAAAVASSGTITTAGVTSARVAPTGAVTGVILQSGTAGGQVCAVVNESAAANTVTFAASGTSHVADGTSSVIAGLTARRFVWDSGTSLWYPCK